VSNVSVGHKVSDHCVVYFDVKINRKLVENSSRKVFLYSKGNYNQILSEAKQFKDEFLQSLPWQNTVNQNWLKLVQFVKETVSKNVPYKNIRANTKPSWLNPHVKRLINKRNRLFCKLKHSNNPDIRSTYNKIRNKVTNLVRNSYRNHVNKLIENVDNNARPFYKYIKSQKCEGSTIPPLNHRGNIVTSDKPKATIFNNYFASVFNNTQTTVQYDTGSLRTINDLNITESGVQNLLSKINVGKSIGPDELPSKILFEARQELAPVITIIFKQSLETGKLPEDWLKANVTPVYKKGDKSNVENYRPISLTCVCCKIMEHIIHSHISDFLQKHNILLQNQHGFRQNHSCITQLISAFNDWSLSLDNRIPVCVAIFDFSKAFDTVSHSLLLKKLLAIGIDGKVHSWIKAFLFNRTQRVVINGCHSDWLPVTSGVPQGSVLGPLLFLLYINDIGNGISSTLRLFADDLIIYRKINDNNSHAMLQQDINTLYNWSKTWAMKFNETKCHMVLLSRNKDKANYTYQLGNSVLPFYDKFTYLGVTADADLNWSGHINTVYNKATRVLNFIKRNTSICSKKYKSLAYLALVRPHLEYASAVWDPHYKVHIDLLNKVQNRAARFCLGNYQQTSSVSDMIKQLGWPQLATRRKSARLVEFYKIVNRLSPVPGDLLRKSVSKTRSAQAGYTYTNIYARTNSFKFSFFPRTVSEWNMLPVNIAASNSMPQFYTSLNKYLVQH
jgi:hypothetical protein